TNTTIELPDLSDATDEVLEKTFTLEYLGANKDRSGYRSAYGFVNGDWSAEFPEELLRKFFEGQEAKQPPGAVQTLYQKLLIFESATPEEIKKAYRRLSLQWHPDVCQEENAADMFRSINEAYKVLIDPEQRKRYDAGLYFERQNKPDPTPFRAPKRVDLDLYG